MCIIVAKIKGSDFPSTDIISNCIARNPDGFAMAWNTPEGTVETFRTMDPDMALSKYAELSRTLDPAVTGLLFHARIATHGSKRIENCHCWTERLGKHTIAFAHNGILRNIPNRDDMTDSETFFRDYLLPVLRGAGWKSAKNLADIVAGCTSKFAFLSDTGGIELTGEFIKHRETDAKGVCYYSNSTFMSCSGYGYMGGLFDRSCGYGYGRGPALYRNAQTGQTAFVQPAAGKQHGRKRQGKGGHAHQD